MKTIIFLMLLSGVIIGQDLERWKTYVRSDTLIFPEPRFALCDTTAMPFRGDTLWIIESPGSYLNDLGKVVIVNLDIHGLFYWDRLRKIGLSYSHTLKYKGKTIQDQLEAIFRKEREIFIN